ncbi:nucleoporin Gle1-like, partial [Teleopsis dalmanni]
DKFEKLYNFISGQPTKVPDGIISVNDHPLGRDYCMLLMTKKMVKQGDSQIASSAPAAFPVASVAISLWKLIPDFGILFLAYLFKESPYLVPYYIPQQPQQSVEDYFKVLGYTFKDGVIEKQDLFLQRHAGFARLFSAIMITNGRQADGHSHPFSIDQCWIWLSNLVNLEPMPDICTTVLSEVLHVVSPYLYATYGKQFVKLLVFIRQSYIPKVKEIDSGGATTRLELMLDNCLMKGVFPTPTGILPQNFW